MRHASLSAYILALVAFAAFDARFTQPADAQSACSSRTIGERCQITAFSADAGSCSRDTGCSLDTGWLEFAVPTGYAVVNWRPKDQSWNGGTFQAQNASRGQRSSWNSAYQSFNRSMQEQKLKIEYLSKQVSAIADFSARNEAQRKLDAYSSELRQAESRWSSASSVDTNTDLFKLRAQSWYTCTRKAPFGGWCIDGKGNHGKGRIVVDLVYIGDPGALINKEQSIRQGLTNLQGEITRAQSITPPQPQCPVGTQWNGSACQASATPQCPPGSQWNGQNCFVPANGGQNNSGCQPGESVAACLLRLLITPR